jgi:parvulin-like peptidyl-prolyl isomerase
MKMNKIFPAAIAALALVVPSIHAASSDTAMPGAATTNSPDAMTALFGDPAVASGKGFQIKRSDLDQVLSGFKSAAMARGQEIPPDRMTQLEAQMLERLIDIQLLLQKANDADKATGTKKADEAMATLREKAGTQDALDMQLKAAGTTETELRAKVSQEATAMTALQRELGVNVGDADIQKFYDAHPQDFEEPEMVHVRHILLMTIDPTTREPLSDDVVQAKRKTADEVLKRARAGEDFAKLAGEFSEDPSTKDKGGDLPPFAKASADPQHAMVPEFEAAAFSLTNNQVSDIVKTVYGYHIIKLIDKTPAKKLAMTDVLPESDNTTVSSRIKDYLIQQKTDELAPPYLDKLKKTADVKILDPDISAAMDAMAAAATNTAPAGVPPAEK